MRIDNAREGEVVRPDQREVCEERWLELRSWKDVVGLSFDRGTYFYYQMGNVILLFY